MNQLKHLFGICRQFSSFFKKSVQKTWIIDKSVGSLQSIVNVQKLPEDIKIDGDIIDLLERLSLVLCATKRAIETLEASVQFADQILEVNVTDNVPLITHLENIALFVRDDVITDGNCKRRILKNASVTEDEYFVTPPGNIIENSL